MEKTIIGYVTGISINISKIGIGINHIDIIVGGNVKFAVIGLIRLNIMQKINSVSIVGRNKHTGLDFYETPEWATRKVITAMYKDELFNDIYTIYEPCCGTGKISKVLEDLTPFIIKSSDIQTEDYIYGDKGVNVYDMPDNVCDMIFTNPPYNLMTKENMLLEFLRIAKRYVVLLLNIYFLSSKDRKQILENSHLRHIYIHSDRVTMYPFGQIAPKNGGTKMFAWFIWDKEYIGRPTLSWI